MQRYKCIVEYDGTDFSGWQIQDNARSVQAELERALQSLLQEDIRVHGAGRTDSGVHAAGMTAHFESETAMDPPAILKGANALLPSDVAVLEVQPVVQDFHARFSASSRKYHYIIGKRKSAIGRAYQWVHYGALDVAAIQKAVSLLNGTHDFGGFSKRSDTPGHRYCYVFEAAWDSTPTEEVFTIKANRFLYGMVRCIAGGLLQVGKGALTPEAFGEILASGDPARVPMLLPACGLTLTEVLYDESERAVVQAEMDTLRTVPAQEETDD